MTTIRLHGKTDRNGDLVVHLGKPDATVEIDLTVVDEKEISQEQWSARFEELASKIDPSAFERLPQTPLRDPFAE